MLFRSHSMVPPTFCASCLLPLRSPYIANIFLGFVLSTSALLAYALPGSGFCFSAAVFVRFGFRPSSTSHYSAPSCFRMRLSWLLIVFPAFTARCRAKKKRPFHTFTHFLASFPHFSFATARKNRFFTCVFFPRRGGWPFIMGKFGGLRIKHRTLFQFRKQ